MKNFLIKLHQWALSHPAYVRPLHTFIQSFIATFVVGVSGILGTHSIKDAETALIALIVASLAAGLSAAKSQVWPIVVSWASSTDTHITPPTDFIPPR